MSPVTSMSPTTLVYEPYERCEPYEPYEPYEL